MDSLTIIDDLDAAHSTFVAERDRIRRDYGAGASTKPAHDTFTAALVAVDWRFADVYRRDRFNTYAAFRQVRIVDAKEPEYKVYLASLAANAALAPLLTDDQLIDRLRSAVADTRGPDARALREITMIRSANPSEELRDLQRTARDLGFSANYRQVEDWIDQVEAAQVAYQVKRAEYAKLLDQGETPPSK